MNRRKQKLYAVSAQLDDASKLLRAIAAVDPVIEGQVRGFTEFTVLFIDPTPKDDLEKDLRSPFVGRFGDGWLNLRELTAEQWDRLM